MRPGTSWSWLFIAGYLPGEAFLCAALSSRRVKVFSLLQPRFDRRDTPTFDRLPRLLNFSTTRGGL